MADSQIAKKAVLVSAENHTKEQMLKEASLQSKALSQLIRWRNNMVILSALFLVFGYCGLFGNLVPHTAGVVCFIAALFSLAMALLMHRSIRHGRKNVKRIQKLAREK